MKTHIAHTNIQVANAQTEKNLMIDLFVESSLSILGFIALVLLIV